MAMVRTIQHPGIQIQETDLTGYSSTVITNNAYIMGFADRGPIYDYSWITTVSEFTKIYGEPQTEAEKFLFTAVQSVLQNGGTPIVARMPYDNKQCKAYKALKLKWGDATSAIDTDLASPLIPLSAVAASIDMDKDFSEIFVSGAVTVNGNYASQDYIDKLSIVDLLQQLNPYQEGTAESKGTIYEDFKYGLKLNGKYPSGLAIEQLAVSSMVESCLKDQTKRKVYFYSFDEGYNVVTTMTSGAALETLPITDTYYEIRDKFYELKNAEGTAVAYINLFSSAADIFNDKPVYGYDRLPENIVNDYILTDSAISGKYLNGKFIVDNKTFFTNSKTANNIFDGDIVAYYYNNASVAFSVEAKIDHLPVYTKFDWEAITGSYFNLCVQDGEFNLSAYTSIFGSVAGAGVVKTPVGACANTNDIVIAKRSQYIDTLFELYEGTTNGLDIDPSGNVSIYDPTAEGASKQLVAYYNKDIESPAVFGEFNGLPVYSFENWKESAFVAVDGTTHYLVNPEEITGGTAFKDDNFKQTNGEVEFIYRYEVPVTIYLNDLTLDKIDDYVISENESVMYLKTIYNDPYFLRKDSANIAKLDASLLITDEMGFKYGLYLDSEDTEISNDQYDDLVTVNQFKAVDRTVSKYGRDIDDANFIIVDKTKSIAQGVGNNDGYFVTVVDPFDALKVQRLLVSPADKVADSREINVYDENGNFTGTKKIEFDHSEANITRLDYWAYESANAWNTIYDDIINTCDTLQRVQNADGIYIGEPNPVNGKKNIMDSWSVPLTGNYYDDSISKRLMKQFPAIAMADIPAGGADDEETATSIIDHQYGTHILVAVCRTMINPQDGKITVETIETFFGSLFNEKNMQNGRSLFIGDIINDNSEYIQFFKNNYVNAGDAGAYDPPEYRRTPVNQIFIKDSEDLKNAAQLRGIDADEYGMDSPNAEIREEAEAEYIRDLAKKNIYVIDKKDVCIYNIHPEAVFTSFSKKESQKVIANTDKMTSSADGTTINVAKNFLVDMDRCINFIKNIDDIQIHFVCDAGLSTIAQFCDNVVWNPNKRSIVGDEIDPETGLKTGRKKYVKTGGWITQPFAPDDDPDGEDRYITGYADIATWRKVVDKLTSISAEIRRDCMTIIDAPRQLTLDGAAPKLRRSKFTNNFDKTIGKALRFISGINSSYTAGYYNWLRTTDQYTGKSIWIPPTSKIIGNYIYLNLVNLPWLAPAGMTYGIINGIHAISHNPNYQEEDEIYMKSWNYVKSYPVEGFIVEGQKTTLTKNSAFNRVNVRLLFLDLERYVYNVSKYFKYQVNNQYTREQYVQTLKPKFEDYMLRGGMYEYMIVCNDKNNTSETIDANELRTDIFIKPARLIEFILVNFVATNTGANFAEIQL